MYYYFTSFYGCSQVSHCMAVPHAVSSFINWWTFRLFQLFGFMNNTTYNFCTSFCLNTCLQFSWTALYLGEELLDHMGTWQLTFWVTVRLFSRVAVPFYMPTSNAWGFQCPTSLQTLVIAHSFYYGHLSGHEMSGADHLVLCLVATFL